MFSHSQQDHVWSEGLGPQAETLPREEHGAGQQWLSGGQTGVRHKVKRGLNLAADAASSPCDEQLWFSNGPGMLVLDCWSLRAVRRLEAYVPPSSVVAMTTSFTPWEEEAVWMLDDHVNMLLLYHAASFQLCAKYW